MFSILKWIFNPWCRKRWWFIAYRTSSSTGWFVAKVSGDPNEAIDKALDMAGTEYFEAVPTFVAILKP